MKSARKALVFLATLLVICCLCSCRGRTIVGRTYADASRYSAGSFSYRASGVDIVKIDYVAGDVTVVQSASGTLDVTETGRNLSEAQSLHWLLDGDTLRIQYCKSGYTGNIPEKRVTVEIPKGVQLEVSTTSGDIILDGDMTNSQTSVGSTSGDLTVGNLRTGRFEAGSTSGNKTIGSLHAEEDADFGSTSGNTKIGGIVAENINFGGTSGNFEADNITCGELDAGCTSANITLGFNRCGVVKIGCTSGNVTITKLPEGGASIDFDHTSGDLRADEYTVKGKRMVFGNGTCDMEISTTSGDLTIR